MQIKEYEFICEMISRISSWQVSLFKGEELSSRHCFMDLAIDTLIPIKASILDDERSYFIHGQADFIYGVIKPEKDVTVVLGPIPSGETDRASCLHYLQSLGESREHLENVYKYFLFATPVMAINFPTILNFVNYIFTKNTDFDGNMIYSSVKRPLPPPSAERAPVTTAHAATQRRPHNSWKYEEKLFSYVEEGNLEGYTEYANKFPFTGRVGKVAEGNLRQNKNIAITTTTLASRAAIRGGLDPEIAYSMSDNFAQTIESTTNIYQLNQLSGSILPAFIAKVADIRDGLKGNKFAISVKKYIMDNIDQRITTTDVAEALDMNRTQLCNKFKMITGKTLAAFIIEMKIRDAERLLKTTNKTLADISYYLAFSSQSHFQNTFKRITGHTPMEYREKFAHM